MATRTRLPLQSVFYKNGLLFRSGRLVHTKTDVKQPAYPPIVPSRTAKSKSAKKLLLEEHVNKVCTVNDVQEKLTLLTKIQRKKYVLNPQTFALNSDKWYQHFTKTAYLPGLPDKFSIVTESKDESAPDDLQSVPSSAAAAIDENAYADIRLHFINAILQENWYMKKPRHFTYREQEHNVAPFLRNLMSGLTYALAKHNPMLQCSSLGKRVGLCMALSQCPTNRPYK